MVRLRLSGFVQQLIFGSAEEMRRTGKPPVDPEVSFDVAGRFARLKSIDLAGERMTIVLEGPKADQLAGEFVAAVRDLDVDNPSYRRLFEEVARRLGQPAGDPLWSQDPQTAAWHPEGEAGYEKGRPGVGFDHPPRAGFDAPEVGI